MTFRPQIGDPLLIDGVVYHVVAHPHAPGMPYGQEGRQATVYQLMAGTERQALKVFKPRYRVPALVGLSERQAVFEALPGLAVCRRTVLTARRHTALLRQHPDLSYAVLMPWIAGPTWMEVLFGGQTWSREQSQTHCRVLAEALVRMEELGLAHCDLSGSNLLLPSLANPVSGIPLAEIELVDVEQMYGPGLDRPDLLPAGSPGYAHRTATSGLWEPAADRFAGAVLLAELLCWADPTVRTAAWGDSYFDPAEMQQDGERLRTLLEVLRAEAGEAVANLFVRTWRSETLADCPTFGDWLLVLPESSTLERVRSAPDGLPIMAASLPISAPSQPLAPYLTPKASVPTRAVADEPDLAVLFDAGLAALQAGDHDQARELLEAVARRRPDYERSGQSVTTLLARTGRAAQQAAGSTGRSRTPWLALPGILMVLVILAGVWLFVVTAPHTPANQPGSPTSATPTRLAMPVAMGTVLTAANVDRIEILGRLGKGPAGPLAWSPDGRILAVGSSYGIYFYDSTTLSELLFISQETRVQAVAFSPTNELLASAGYDGKLYIWRSDTGQLVRTLEGHLGPVRAVAFSPNGKVLLSGGMDTTVRLWSVSSGEETRKLDGLHTVVSVAFSPDGTRLAAISDHGEIRLWQANDGLLLRELKGSPGTNVAFSPDGTMLAAASGEYDQPSISLWKVSDGQLVHALQGNTGSYETVAFSPDGTLLASGSQDSTIRVWKVSDGSMNGAPTRQSGPIRSIAFSPDGAVLASSGNGDTIGLTTILGPGSDRQLTGHTERTRALTYDSQGTLFALGNGDGSISLWQASDSSPLRTLRGHTAWVNALDFSPDGTLLASGSADNTVRLWRVGDGSLVRALPSTGNRAVLSVDFSPDGQLLVGSDEGGTIYLWQLSNGSLVRKLTGYSAVFSPDGNLLGTSGEDKLVQLWNVTDWILTRTLQSLDQVRSIAFSPDGTLLAGGGSNVVQFWRVSDGSLIAAAQEDAGGVLSVAFSSDCALLATGSSDAIVRIWQVADARLLNKLSQHTDAVWQVAFQPDGVQLASISEDGSLIHWGLP